MAFFKLIHLLSALIWVGGMFFAFVVLRPAAVEVLEPPQRLQLWDAVFRRFFLWVWRLIGVLLVSGFYMIYLFGGFASVSHTVHMMLLLGVVMMVVFAYLFFACYVSFGLHVAKQRWKEAGERLVMIRNLIGLNLMLGLLIISMVMVARAWN